ncbi:hypothetical protein RCL_jg12142.t1 [Rhizophagus clarus]|uniref:Uncharacterized protein n=1 Tax=Rhizophagus clarus TaxID=94130 RepID=A0A8H3KZK3_9GLOM|nr:hypothetical protein RCL_jg12142.t1 [Rhizophagus clarus]
MDTTQLACVEQQSGLRRTTKTALVTEDNIDDFVKGFAQYAIQLESSMSNQPSVVIYNDEIWKLWLEMFSVALFDYWKMHRSRRMIHKVVKNQGK